VTADPAVLPPDLAVALSRAFPDLGTVAPLQVIGEGFRNLVVETANGIVFRIGKNPAAAERHRREVQLLPLLQARLPIAIPDPRWHAPPSAEIPFGALAYHKLPGTSLGPAMLHRLDVRWITEELAAFLVALHRVPIDETAEIGLVRAPVPEVASEDLRQEGLPVLRSLLSAGEYDAVEAWWSSFLADPVLRTYTSALRHGDLWYEHVLIDEASGHISGILDFEDAAIGDPAQDLAVQLHLGRPFLDRVLDAYREAGGTVDASFVHRTWRLWEAREVAGVLFAARYDDPTELQDAIRKLRAGPILNPAAWHF
jgi:aminoglycoside phosphotransferase (APT) family kinase protein